MTRQDQRFKSRGRYVTPEEAEELRKVRAQIMEEFPPKGQPPKTSPMTAIKRIAAELKKARQDRGLTCSAVAQAAGITTPHAIEDLEAAGDVQLSTLSAVAESLGLRLELVPANSANA